MNFQHFHLVSLFFSICRITFIADERFQAYFKETTKEWILQIKYVQERDAGIYECQVSTEPKVSARAHLHVVGELIDTLFNFFQYYFDIS